MTKVNLSATLPVSGHTVWDVIGGEKATDGKSCTENLRKMFGR